MSTSNLLLSYIILEDGTLIADFLCVHKALFYSTVQAINEIYGAYSHLDEQFIRHNYL